MLRFSLKRSTNPLDIIIKGQVNGIKNQVSTIQRNSDHFDVNSCMKEVKYHLDRLIKREDLTKESSINLDRIYVNLQKLTTILRRDTCR